MMSIMPADRWRRWDKIFRRSLPTEPDPKATTSEKAKEDGPLARSLKEAFLPEDPLPFLPSPRSRSRRAK